MLVVRACELAKLRAAGSAAVLFEARRMKSLAALHWLVAVRDVLRALTLPFAAPLKHRSLLTHVRIPVPVAVPVGETR